MKKKYLVPSITLVQVELQHMCNVSGRVDDTSALTYEDDPQDPSGGMSRRHNDIWEDEEEYENE